MAKSTAPRRGKEALTNTQATKDRLAALGAIQYGLAEVAEDFGASEADVTAFFARWPSARHAFEQSVAEARRSQRTAQFKLAEKSPTLAIFLGKHYLGQTGRRELDTSAKAAQIAEAAEDAGFVRAALAALAASGRPPGDRGGGENGGEQQTPEGLV